MSEARKLHRMGGTLGADEHGFRAIGDRLAQWATDVRQLGVRMAVQRQRLLEIAMRDPDLLADLKETLDD